MPIPVPMSIGGPFDDDLRELFIFYFSPCLKNSVFYYHHLSKLCRKIGLCQRGYKQNLRHIDRFLDIINYDMNLCSMQI